MKISNKSLSVENIIALSVLLVAVVTSYTSLATESAETKGRVLKIESNQKALSASMKGIEVDVAVIKNEQAHVKKELEEQSQDLKRVLRILEKTHD